MLPLLTNVLLTLGLVPDQSAPPAGDPRLR
jgi:hypothetical protein